MCLIKIRKEEDEDEYVPVRRVVRTSRERVGVRTSSPHRHSSKVIAVHTPEPRIVVPPPPRPLPVESAPGYQVPPPQPTPVFVQPPPPPPPAPAAPQTEVHYVHVSPRSSISNDHSHGRNEDDLYTYRREVRYERDYSPPRDDYYHYRHVEGPPRSRSRHRERSRSRSRRRYEDEYDDYSDDGRRRTVRVKRTSYRD